MEDEEQGWMEDWREGVKEGREEGETEGGREREAEKEDEEICRHISFFNVRVQQKNADQEDGKIGCKGRVRAKIVVCAVIWQSSQHGFPFPALHIEAASTREG